MARRTLSHENPTEEYGSSTFYTKMAQNQANSLIYCRKKGEQEEVLFDLRELVWVQDLNNAYAESIRISPDQRYLAFLIDPENNEEFEAGIKNLTTKQVYVSSSSAQELRMKGCASIEFSQDSKSIYYVEMNELRRPFRLKKRKIEGQSKEEVLYQQKDPQRYLSAQMSKDKKYIIIQSQSWEDSVVFVIPQVGVSKEALIPMVAPVDKIMMNIDHVRDVFVAVSNKDGAKNMKVSILEDKYLNQSRSKKLQLFQDIIVPKEGEVISEIDRFKDYVVAYVSKCGINKILKYSFEEQKVYEILLKGEETKMKEDKGLGTTQPGINLEYESSKLYYYFSSLLQFENQYELDLAKNTISLSQKTKMKGPKIRRSNYVYKQVVAPGHDGEEIPITILHQRDISLDHKNKLLIQGYGAYGIPVDLNFHVTHLAAVDNEWIIAYPHIRGGNDKGKEWHEDGKLLNKDNSIRDFLSATKFLISEGYSHPNYVAAEGSSAGGLLVGEFHELLAASVNLRPDLFRACVLSVPFLDIVSILSDQNIPLSETDYPQFGNPKEVALYYQQSPLIYDCQMSYSPYENIQVQEYPAMLINVSLDDPRIPTWSVLKYIQKLRDLAEPPSRMPQFVKGSKNLVLRVLGKGHLGSANNKLNLEDSAWDLAWLDSMLFKAKKSWLF